jgi:hypothetical protein
LEKNGKASSSKRTKHINIQYLLITDRISNEELLLVLCPTGDMIEDYAAKPLQGALFRKLRDHIMGVAPTRDTGPGKTDSGFGKTETSKTKPSKGKVKSLVPPGKKAAQKECVESQTRDRAKAEPGLVKKIADPAIFNQSSGKSVSYSHTDCVGQAKHTKIRSLLHLTSKR